MDVYSLAYEIGNEISTTAYASYYYPRSNNNWVWEQNPVTKEGMRSFFEDIENILKQHSFAQSDIDELMTRIKIISWDAWNGCVPDCGACWFNGPITFEQLNSLLGIISDKVRDFVFEKCS